MTIRNDSLNHFGHIVNGACSTGIMLLTLQPLNTVKTYIMAGKGMPSHKALYRGMTPVAINNISVQSLSFFTQGFFVKRYFQGTRENMSAPEKIIVATASAISTSPLSTVLDRIMILCQLNKEDPRLTIRKIVSQKGVKSLFKGYVPTLGRDLSFAAGLWAFSDIFTKYLTKKLPHFEGKEKATPILGKLIAGFFFGALSTPIDVVKTRMQSDQSEVYPTAWKTVIRLLEKEGPHVFIRGLATRMALISSSILVLGYSKEKVPSILPNIFKENA